MLIDSPINALECLFVRQDLSFCFKLGCSHIIAVNVIVWLLSVGAEDIFLCKTDRRSAHNTLRQFDIHFFLEKLQVPNDDPSPNGSS